VVLLGVLVLILCLASQLVLLSWADLSFVAPVTSIGYVLTALAGKLLLHEPLSAPRWAAILLIAGGVTLVARTPPSTAAADGHGGCDEMGDGGCDRGEHGARGGASVRWHEGPRGSARFSAAGSGRAPGQAAAQSQHCGRGGCAGLIVPFLSGPALGGRAELRCSGHRCCVRAGN